VFRAICHDVAAICCAACAAHGACAARGGNAWADGIPATRDGCKYRQRLMWLRQFLDIIDQAVDIETMKPTARS
jgi:hypothetical protein